MPVCSDSHFRCRSLLMADGAYAFRTGFHVGEALGRGYKELSFHSQALKTYSKRALVPKSFGLATQRYLGNSLPLKSIPLRIWAFHSKQIRDKEWEGKHFPFYSIKTKAFMALTSEGCLDLFIFKIRKAANL